MMDKDCGHCKHFNQDKNSCRCFNPMQTDESLRRYCYYNFRCDLFELGGRQTKKQMEESGYEKTWREVKYTSGEIGGYFYYAAKTDK